MVRLGFAILLLASLPACSVLSSARAVFPTPPPLDAQTEAECPPLPPLVDASIASVGLALAEWGKLYADCQTKHRGAVRAYNETRDRLIEAGARGKGAEGRGD